MNLAVDRSDDDAASLTNRGPAWLPWTALAAFAALAHVLIDAHIGLWGETSDDMSALQAANAAVLGALYAWWMVIIGLAVQGYRAALRSALVLAVVFVGLLNGLFAFIAAPPPSAAFPYQDLAHGGSLVFGAVAGLSLWRNRTVATRDGWSFVLPLTIALVVVREVLGAVVFFQYA